jgi:Ca-activated chloride channel family protein
MSHPHRCGKNLGRQALQLSSSLLLLAGLLLPGLALAQMPADDLPDWAIGHEATWAEGKKEGTLRVTGKVTPRFLGTLPQDVFVVLEVRALDFPQMEPLAASVVVIMDRSASTQGQRLLIAKKAAQDAIAGLNDRDRLGIILVSDRPKILEIEPAIAEHRRKMTTLIEETLADGRSDISAALDAAIEMLSEPAEQPFYRQVLLISDGQPTDGMVDAAGLAEIARDAREQKSVHISTVSIGEDSNADLMAGIAKQGWGFAARLGDSSEVTRVSNRQKLEIQRRAAAVVELTLKVSPLLRIVDVYGHDAVIKGSTIRVAVGEVGPGEVVPLVLHLSTVNVGKQARSLEIVQGELQYENAFTERLRTQSFTLKAEIDPERAQGRGALDTEALRIAARAFAERKVAWADETAEEGDRATAEKILSDTREALKDMGTHARLAVLDALGLLYAQGPQVLKKERPAAKAAQVEKKKR